MPCILTCQFKNKIFKSSGNQADDIILLTETQEQILIWSMLNVRRFCYTLGHVQEVFENRWTQEEEV